MPNYYTPFQQQLRDIRRLTAVKTQESARRYVRRDAFRRLNERRIALIRRRSKLTGAERAELEHLQAVVFRLTDLAYPVGRDPAFEKKLGELLARAEVEGGGRAAKG